MSRRARILALLAQTPMSARELARAMAIAMAYARSETSHLLMKGAIRRSGALREGPYKTEIVYEATGVPLRPTGNAGHHPRVVAPPAAVPVRRQALSGQIAGRCISRQFKWPIPIGGRF